MDFLKVDRAFVTGLGENSDDSAIVAGVVGLANALGVEAVAEGVEERPQAERLMALGCDLGQGFLWSKPLPPAELERSFALLWPEAVERSAQTDERVRVVLADDRAEMRQVVRMALELEGVYEVVGEAGNGLEAIDVARQQQPDLVLLDVLMPGMSGLDALPQIVRAAPRAKVVFLTLAGILAVGLGLGKASADGNGVAVRIFQRRPHPRE